MADVWGVGGVCLDHGRRRPSATADPVRVDMAAGTKPPARQRFGGVPHVPMPASTRVFHPQRGGGEGYGWGREGERTPPAAPAERRVAHSPHARNVTHPPTTPHSAPMVGWWVVRV